MTRGVTCAQKRRDAPHQSVFSLRDSPSPRSSRFSAIARRFPRVSPSHLSRTLQHPRVRLRVFHSSRISLPIHVERHSGNRRALFLLLAVPFVADAFQPRQLHALWFLLPSLRRSVPVPPSVVRDARNRRIRLLPRPRRASRARAATVAPFRSTFARARPVANRFTKTRVDAPIPRIARRRARSRRNNLTRAVRRARDVVRARATKCRAPSRRPSAGNNAHVRTHEDARRRSLDAFEAMCARDPNHRAF